MHGPSDPGGGGGREVARDRGARLGLRQLGVLLQRQWLVKRRSPLATLMEIFIPVLLMSLLVLGSDLSVVRNYRRQIFADKGIVDVNSKTWKDFKDLVELESRELCEAAGRNVSGLVDNSTETNPLDDDVPIPTAMFGLLSRLADADADAAAIARDTQDFLIQRLGYVETLTLEVRLFLFSYGQFSDCIFCLYNRRRFWRWRRRRTTRTPHSPSCARSRRRSKPATPSACPGSGSTLSWRRTRRTGTPPRTLSRPS